MVSKLLGVQNIIMMFPYFTAAFILLIIGKIVFQKTTSYCIDDELTEKDNPAMGILLGGYLLGLALAISTTITGQGIGDVASLKAGFMTIGVFGACSIVLLRLSVIVMDKLILSKFSVHKEITKDQNIGVALVTAGSCVASGLMIAGVMSGTSDSLLIGIRDMVAYWVLGQVILVIGSKLFQKFTSYDDQKLLEGGDGVEVQNIPIGLLWCGFLIAQGIIIKATLTGATSDLLRECMVTAAASLVGLLLFAVIHVVTDRFLLPKSKISKEIAEDHNPAAGVVCGVAFVAIALLLSPIVNPMTNGTAENVVEIVEVVEKPAAPVVAETPAPVEEVKVAAPVEPVKKQVE